MIDGSSDGYQQNTPSRIGLHLKQVFKNKLEKAYKGLDIGQGRLASSNKGIGAN